MNAIEASARAHYGHYGDTSWWDNGMSASIKAEMLSRQRAAIIAFLRNCETVSPAMVDALEAQFQHWKNDTGTNGPFIRANAFWQVLRETVVTELEGK
jgi:hypothetical protein